MQNNIVRDSLDALEQEKDEEDISSDALSSNEVDINILSSEYEGVSGVTLEAFFTKKPYLGSNVEGIRK